MNTGAQPTIRSKQLSCTCVTAFSPSMQLIFREIWREFRMSLLSHKPVRKTYAPENGIFDLLISFMLLFSYIMLRVRSQMERSFHFR